MDDIIIFKFENEKTSKDAWIILEVEFCVKGSKPCAYQGWSQIKVAIVAKVVEIEIKEDETNDENEKLHIEEETNEEENDEGILYVATNVANEDESEDVIFFLDGGERDSKLMILSKQRKMKRNKKKLII